MDSQSSSHVTSSTEDQSTNIVEGQRYGQLIKLKPEYEERYIALHAHPFPGLIEQLRAANLHNYSIFLRDGLLFSFYEYSGDDYEEDMGAVASSATVKDWWTLTDPMQESLSSEDSDEWWVVMEEVFHGGGKAVPSRESVRRAYVQLLPDEGEEEVHRAFSEVETELREAIQDAGVQNYGAYHWKGRLYTYFESASDRIDSSFTQLQATSAFQHLQRRLSALRPTDSSTENGEGMDEQSLHPMEAVFYME